MSDPQSTPTPSDAEDNRKDFGTDAKRKGAPPLPGVGEPSEAGSAPRLQDEGGTLAVARGAIYRLLAQGFRAPDECWLAELEDAAGDVAAVGFAEVWPEAEDASLVAALAGLLEALPTAAKSPHRRDAGATTVDETADLHRRLFGHTVAGQCPLYETEFGQWAAFQQPHTLSDLKGTYRAFGLVFSDAVQERPDHLSLECEFLYVLSHKEAWARRNDGPAEVAICVDARRLFLTDHLGQWAPALAGRLAKHAPISLYTRLGDLLEAMLDHDCRTLGVRMGDRDLAVGVREDAVDFACASCSEGSEDCSGPPPAGQGSEEGP